MIKRFFVLVLSFLLLTIFTLNVSAQNQLPENNKLLDTAWTKGLGTAKIKKEIIDNEEVYTMTNMDSSFASAYLDIYPSIKALIGEEVEISVWIVLDVRVINTNENKGADFPFGMKLRPNTTALTTTEAAFNKNYYGEAESFKHQFGSVSASIFSGMTATEEWTRFEFLKSFTDYDINDNFWTKWNLCFDGMSEFANGSSLQIKNVGIFLEEDYESVEVNNKTEESKPASPTPTPFQVYKPFNFDKYEITFAEALDPSESKLTFTPNHNDTPLDDQNSSISTSIFTVFILITVLIIPVVIVIVIKRKGEKNDK